MGDSIDGTLSHYNASLPLFSWVVHSFPDPFNPGHSPVAGTVGCGSGGDEGGTKTLSLTAVPDPSVLGYKAYWGTSSPHYESNTDVGANTSYTISGLQHGSRYFFAVSAYNADGESGLSAEVSAVVE